MVFDKLKGKGKPRCAQNPHCFGQMVAKRDTNNLTHRGNNCHPCGWYLNLRRKYDEYMKWLKENGGKSFRIIEDFKFIDDVLMEEKDDA